MEPPDVARAIDAAISIVAALDLPADDATVLQNSNKLALRLLPCDVFARIAQAGQRSHALFEVELAQRLAGTGSPVAALEPRVAPRRYERDGFEVTLWTYYEPATPEIRTSRLRRRARAPARRNAQARCPDAALHGSPRADRCSSTSRTCCRGPVEFDLAHVPDTVSACYPGVDHALLGDCRQLVLAMVAAWRWQPGDQLPNGVPFRRELLRALRAGPPWSTIDEVFGRR